MPRIDSHNINLLFKKVEELENQMKEVVSNLDRTTTILESIVSRLDNDEVEESFLFFD